MAAGLVDSFCLSMAWTVVVLEVTRRHGLLAAGLCSTAMLVGVALSAPIATWMAHHLDGRRLLRVAGLIEAAMRISVFALLATGASVWLIALCVTAMNVVAWTGYAGMRAEVAAADPRGAAMTWYMVAVAAIEAAGTATAALLPTGHALPVSGGLLVAVIVCYGACLLPTWLVAGGAQVRRASPARASRLPRPPGVRRPNGLPRPNGLLASGGLVMLLGRYVPGRPEGGHGDVRRHARRAETVAIGRAQLDQRPVDVLAQPCGLVQIVVLVDRDDVRDPAPAKLRALEPEVGVVSLVCRAQGAVVRG